MNQITPFLINKLLVPLDGSRLAESTMPSAIRIALLFNANIILLHIREQNAPSTIHGEKHLSDTADANRYLQSMAENLQSKGVGVEWHVHDSKEGDVARSIVEHADEFQPDLVVLCTHGKGGVRDIIYGSIAQQTLNRGKWPILLIQPDEHGTVPEFNPRHILVPIDRDHSQDAALSVSASMAKVFSSSVRLLAVVPTLETLSGEKSASGSLLPTTTRAILDIAEQEGAEFVEKIASEEPFSELEAYTEILRGDPVQSVLEYANKSDIDLIILSSHARSGLSALISGSFTSRITSRVKCPLLLVRV